MTNLGAIFLTVPLTTSVFLQPQLIRAVFHEDSDEVRAILYGKSEDVNYQDAEKRTALHAAAYIGDPEIVDVLVLSGATVNHKDVKWRTALHRACCSKSDVCF